MFNVPLKYTQFFDDCFGFFIYPYIRNNNYDDPPKNNFSSRYTDYFLLIQNLYTVV